MTGSMSSYGDNETDEGHPKCLSDTNITLPCPEHIIACGEENGNQARLHRKAWLEVSDEPRHRYGKNLRIYFNHWYSIGKPCGSFFEWLDGSEENNDRRSEGADLPNLSSCPRSVLDNDVVQYIKCPNESEKYSTSIIREFEGCDCNVDDSSCNSSFTPRVLVNAQCEPIRTGPKGWIFVLRDDMLYTAPKVTTKEEGNVKKRFHHSSFFGGKAISSAGILITDDSGHLIKLYPHSGHYRPGETEFLLILLYLQKKGIYLEEVEVDLQQIYHVSREHNDDQGHACRVKKMNNLYLRKGDYAKFLLLHKSRMTSSDVFGEEFKAVIRKRERKGERQIKNQ